MLAAMFRLSGASAGTGWAGGVTRSVKNFASFLCVWGAFELQIHLPLITAPTRHRAAMRQHIGYTFFYAEFKSGLRSGF